MSSSATGLVAPSKQRPWYMMNYPRSGRSPFQSLGMDYCIRCKQEVDTDTEAHMRENTYVYRRSCNRCGLVVNWGVYNDVALISPTPLLKTAMEWVTKPGQDRS